jgi:hypothetical protein
MPRWIISFPAWGIDKRGVATHGPLQSVLAALAYANVENALIIINTDSADHFLSLTATCGHEVQFYSVPITATVGLDTYNLYGSCHRQAINLAAEGDYFALLGADLTVSLDTFSAASEIFRGGQKKLILAPASSTYGVAPITTSRELLEWSVDHLTPMCRSLFYETGYGGYPWCVYFPHDLGVDFRAFHLHPVAGVKRRGLTFKGLTADLYLSEEFDELEVYVVTRPDVLAVVETSSFDRARPEGKRVTDSTIARWVLEMGDAASDRQVWHFSHQITLVGEPDEAGPEIGARIGEKIRRYRAAYDGITRWRRRVHRILSLGLHD